MNGRPTTRTVLLAAAGIAVVALLVWGFLEGRKEVATERERERPVKAPLRVSVEEGQVTVTLDEATQARSGILAAPVTSTTRPDGIRAYGTIVELQPLADLSNSYASAVAQSEQTQARLEASRREYQRLQVLYEDDQNVSAKAVEAAGATFRSDQASAEAAAVPVRTLSATAVQQWGPTIAGWVTAGSPALERLLSLKEVLVQVTLSPDVSFSAPPNTAFLQAGGRSRVAARLLSPAARADPRTQGLTLFYLAPASGAFLPGMNVAAFLPAGEERTAVLLPPAAVVWWQGKPWAYLQTDTTTFVRRELPADLSSSDGAFVVRDFPAGARVVVRGAQMLLSEEFRAQVKVGEEEQGRQ